MRMTLRVFKRFRKFRAAHPQKTGLIIAIVEENPEASMFFVFQILITGSEFPKPSVRTLVVLLQTRNISFAVSAIY